MIHKQLDSDGIHTVNAAWKHTDRAVDNVTFGAIDSFERITITDDRLDFDRYRRSTDSNNQVNLAIGNANVAAKNGRPPALQKDTGAGLTHHTDPVSRIGVYTFSGCSSSSMFTSRKVMTLTFFTKRAGRYISHTHASSSSSSK
jgi:hypothetical protein